MGMWVIPALITGIILVAVSYYSSVGVMKNVRKRAAATDTPISKVIREHPLAMNPIIIMYVVFLLFTGIMIFYYWARYGY